MSEGVAINLSRFAKRSVLAAGVALLRKSP